MTTDPIPAAEASAYHAALNGNTKDAAAIRAVVAELKQHRAENARLQSVADSQAKEIGTLRYRLHEMNAVSLHQTDRIVDGNRDLIMRVHPLTCGNDSSHTPLFPLWDSEKVTLICRDCDYTQGNIGAIHATSKNSSDPS